MAVGDAYVFLGFLTPVLTQLFFPKPLTTFLTCFSYDITTHDREQLRQTILKSTTIVKVMVQTNLDRRTIVVTNMSRALQAGFTKRCSLVEYNKVPIAPN